MSRKKKTVSPTAGSEKHRWPHCWPLLVMLGLWLVFWFPIIIGREQLYIRDLTFYALPMKTFMLQRFHEGAFPFWTPHISTGMPFLAEPTHQVLYPFNLLFFVTPTPVHGISWFVILHLLLAQFAFYYLCRVLGFGRPLALWGGLLFGYAGYTLSIGDNVNYLPAVVWAPLGLAAFIRGLQTGWLGHSVVVAAATGLMILAGDTFNPLFLGIFCVLLLLLRRWNFPERSWRFAVLHLLTSFGLGGLIVAVQLLPTWELLRLSVRKEPLSYDEVTLWSFPPQRVIEFIQPYFYGSKYPAPHFIGQFMYPQFREPWADSIYIGLIPALLAVYGFFTRFRQSLYWGLLIAIALLIGFAHYAPYDFHTLMKLFPPIDYQRYLEKLVFWATMGICVLAVIGADALLQQWDVLLEHFRRKARPFQVGWSTLWLVGGTLFLLWIPVSLWIIPHAFERSAEWQGHFYERAPHVLNLLGHWLMVFIPVLVLPWLKQAWQRRYLIFLLILAVGDLLYIHAGQVPSLPTELLTSRPVPLAYRMMQSDHPAQRLRIFYDDKVDYRDEQDESSTLLRIQQAFNTAPIRDNFPYYWAYRFLYNQQRLLFNYGAIYDVGYQNGRYEPLQQKRHKLMDDVLWQNNPNLLPAICGIPYIITSDHPTNKDWSTQDMQVVGRAPDFNLRVLKVVNAVPRAYIAPNAIYNPEPEAVYKILTQGFLKYELTRQVEIAAPIPARPQAAEPLPLNPQAKVTLVEDQPESIVIKTWSPYRTPDSFLVLTESLFPGWQAWLDGKPVPVYLANQRFMGVQLPPGNHEVRFRYHSTYFMPGLLLSLLGFSLAAGILLTPRQRVSSS